MKQETIWQGAAVLMLASLFNRFLSFFYRILVIRLIGPESIGLYEMVFPFYSLILILSTAGIPVALSKLIAEKAALQEWGRVRNLLRMSVLFLLCSGFLTLLILWILSPYLTNKVFADSRVYSTFIVMLFALPVVSLCSGLRGYFQGMQLMRPVALAQVTEQITRVAASLYFGLLFLPKGVPMAAAGLAMGMVLGEVVGLCISGYIFWLSRSYYDIAPFQKSIITDDFYSLFRLSIPVMMAKIVGGVLITLEALIIPRQLQAWGVSVSEATTIYGQYAGIAITLICLPMVITTALSIALVPAIAEAQANKDYNLLNRRCRQALKLTIISGLPFAVIFYLLATPLCSSIFATPEANAALRMLAFGCIFLYLEQTLSGILNGLGAMGTVLKTTVAGGIIDLLGIYYFTPIMGIAGAAVGVNLGCLTTAILNIFALVKYTRIHMSLRDFVVLPFFSACAMAVTITFIWDVIEKLPDMIKLVHTLAAGGIIYFLSLLSFRVINMSHLNFLSWVRPK